jgi:BMFP domain-containing protein YqiC
MLTRIGSKAGNGITKSGGIAPPSCGSAGGSPLFLTRLADTRPAYPDATRPEEFKMVQTTNRLFDEFARLMNDATGVAQGVRREFETLFRTQAERMLRDLDVVTREEFEAVKEMARLAREENEALKARITALETRLPSTTAASN